MTSSSVFPFLVFALICALSNPFNTFIKTTPATRIKLPGKLRRGSDDKGESNCDVARREVLVTLPVVTSLIVAPLVLLPSPAFAERTLGTLTNSYNRNVPRMQDGFVLLTNFELSSDEACASLITEINAERGTTISAMTGTMRIFSTAFSDSVVTKTTRELQLATLKTREELDLLSSSLKTNNKEEAQKHLEQVLFFIDVYVTLANSALPRTMKVTGPRGESQRFDSETIKSEGAF